MKIGQPLDNSSSVGKAAQPATPKGGQSASSIASASAAKSTQTPGVAVTVSTQARALDVASRTDEADVDLAKVSSVRSSIENGSYKVNAEAIADKLLSNAQEMLKQQ